MVRPITDCGKQILSALLIIAVMFGLFNNAFLYALLVFKNLFKSFKCSLLR